jgi:hypothetical protein
MKQARYKFFVLFNIVFLSSLVFPIVASITHIGAFSIVMYCEICFAVLLITLALGIHLRKSRKEIKPRKTTIIIFRICVLLPMLLILLYMTGLTIRWDILLIGFGWRACLLSIVIEELVEIHRKSARIKETRTIYYQ